MASYVTCYCVFLCLLGSTFGRIAFTNLNISIEITRSDQTGQPKSVISINSTEGARLIQDIENEIDFEVNLNPNPTPRNTETSSEADVKDNGSSTPKLNEDNGTALILTPYIEEGRIDDGRKAAEVDPGVFLGVKSYSGFLTVNKTYDSNTFFWYFPVPDKPVNETPWIVWLQGGPGVSSLTGLFSEIGPFTIKDQRYLKRNPHTWLRNHSLVFIDNPVGTGYSFTQHEDGFAKDMETYSKHLYSALRQFLELFPEQRAAPLVIAGESYAGKYVPALAMEVHRHKNFPGGDINLRGLMLGNAYMEPSMLAEITRPYYNFGLLDKEQIQEAQPLIDAFRQDIEAGRSIAAKQKWMAIASMLIEMSSLPHAYNFLQDTPLFAGDYSEFLLKSVIKRALHVGDIDFSLINVTANMALAPEFLSNTRPMLETLLNHYDVMAYCGQLDQMLSCAVAGEHYRKWRWDRRAEFLNATRHPLRFKGKLAGYYKSGGRFTEVVVRGAGHMAAKDAPAPMQWLAAQWTHARPLPRRSRVSAIAWQEYVDSITTMFSNETHAFYLNNIWFIRNLASCSRTVCYCAVSLTTILSLRESTIRTSSRKNFRVRFVAYSKCHRKTLGTVVSGVFTLLCIMRQAVAAVILFGSMTIALILPNTPPLILTPYILQNQTDLARNLSEVNPEIFLNVSSYSGFLTVDKKHDSNLFFWYFPVPDKPLNTTPWIIWLQGGPGVTSLAGLFVEMGPFMYENDGLKLRKSAWTQEYSMLFIDNPVGAGYSFTNGFDGLVQNMDECSNHLYRALQQFLSLFPELRSAPLYVAGESYAGHYVPALAHRILHPPALPDLPLRDTTINLQGVMMGNPIIDRRDEVNLTSVYYQWGLIDPQGVLAVKPLQEKYAKAIQDGDYIKATETRNTLLDKIEIGTGQKQSYNVLKDYIDVLNFQEFVTSPPVRAALHVGNANFDFRHGSANTMLRQDFLVSLTAKVEELLEHYRILIYCGQLDLTAPCVMNAEARRQHWRWSGRQAFLNAPRTPWSHNGTVAGGQLDLTAPCVMNAEARRQHWRWSGRQAFLNAPRTPWSHNGTVAGYVKSGGNFTEVLVRGAGHLVPMDKPFETLELISSFVEGRQLPLIPVLNYIQLDTPPLEEDTIYNKVYNSKGLVASIVLNVFFVVIIALGVVYVIRWRRRHNNYLNAMIDNSSLSDGILTME
ncbi:uncharacterized protein LOC114349567 [Ostrinia furnacalis]|uniref:uncharacterized protein LOC114349567 n=1 Tax=Ostrinia furnacalis TaxID=93504 RepID=UPI00103C92D5|nr:uncharacterized protein LOC114349567 [Ostrinia furnacalis]